MRCYKRKEMLEVCEKEICRYIHYSENICCVESLFGRDESLKKCVINIGHNRPLSRPFKIILFIYFLFLIIFPVLEKLWGELWKIMMNMLFNVKLSGVISLRV